MTSGSKDIWRWPTGLRSADDDKQDLKKGLMSIRAKKIAYHDKKDHRNVSGMNRATRKRDHTFTWGPVCGYHVASDD